MTNAITLFTLHGINTDGKWQENLAAIFSAHYDYVPLKYHGYKGPFGILGMAKLLTGWGFESTYMDIMGRILDHAMKPNKIKFFIIAHSYGTVICAYLTEKFCYLRLHKMIFLGSALNRRFDWSSPMMQGKEFELSNEHGANDAAVSVARWLPRKLVGDAGRVGFQGAGVHTIQIPLSPCDQCDGKPRKDRAKVHNIKLSEYKHSDYFLRSEHARESWLPLLWGFAPARYHVFRQLCQEARECDQHEDWDKLKVVASKLRYLEIEREEGHLVTLGDQAKAYLESHLTNFNIELEEKVKEEDMIPLVIKGVWEVTCDAINHSSDPDKAKALFPRNAMKYAVKALFPAS